MVLQTGSFEKMVTCYLYFISTGCAILKHYFEIKIYFETLGYLLLLVLPCYSSEG